MYANKAFLMRNTSKTHVFIDVTNKIFFFHCKLRQNGEEREKSIHRPEIMPIQPILYTCILPMTAIKELKADPANCRRYDQTNHH